MFDIKSCNGKTNGLPCKILQMIKNLFFLKQCTGTTYAGQNFGVSMIFNNDFKYLKSIDGLFYLERKLGRHSNYIVSCT